MKKGFTLVELIASIALMGIIAIIVAPSIISIRRDVLNNTYESRVRIINNKALDYANDNLIDVPSHVSNNSEICTSSTDSNCFCMKISFLIENEYLSPTDENDTITDPRTNESLNDKYVCVRYTSNNIFERKLVSNIVE